MVSVIRILSRFITLHSRRAETTVLGLLQEAERSPVVFHWYTGSLKTLDLALSDGHYFSVNPSMLASPNGQKIIARLPPDRILTETDGPFVMVGDKAAEPKDVTLVEVYLAALWRTTAMDVRRRVKENFLAIVRPVRPVKAA